MPFLRLSLTPAAAEALADARVGPQLGLSLRDLTAECLGKKPALTSVLIETVPAVLWTIGDDAAPRAAHLEVAITAGTNTGAEKERFLREAMALLTRILGPLPEASYIVISEIPAESWGFDGRTQAARRLATAA